MDRKLYIIMSVLLLVGVSVAALVCLPGRDKSSMVSGRMTSEYYREDENGNVVRLDGGNGENGSGKNGYEGGIENLPDFDGRGYTIVIDGGHGGSDPGKTKGDVLEKDINLVVAGKLEKALKALGYNTVMTRTSDKGLYVETDTNKKRADLKKRCDIANSSGADICVSIHQNSFESSSVSGAQVFYYTYSPEGKTLATCLQQSFRENLDSGNKRVEKPDKTYYLLLHSKIPTVIVECGFITNPSELKLLLDSDYQDKIVYAIIMGINKYFTS